MHLASMWKIVCNFIMEFIEGVGSSKRNVVIKEAKSKDNESESDEQIVATPSKIQTRRSTRAMSVVARAKINVMVEDQSPEMEKAASTKPKTPRTPKPKAVQIECETPRSTGRRSSAVPKTPTNVL